ncbi:MAG: carboxypeptidase M32 [Planctomycetes bacterium]|nr:carboxypeptidase M32 [Planctomycetota bacterium]
MADAYATLIERVREIGRLEAIEYLLDWDQEVYMPAKGVETRADLTAMVAAMKHERRTSSEMGDLLAQLDDDLSDPVRATNIRESRRLYTRLARVPTKLVKEISHTATLSKSVWAKAREDSDFGAFAPLLSKMLDLKRAEAEHIGYDGEPYDALMDEYEPGARCAEVGPIFAELRQRLVPLVRSLAGAPRQPDFSIVQRHYPRAAQEEMGRRFATAMGFDFEAGRLDVSVHPFCTSIGPHDIRITTRYDENYLHPAVFGVMHEAGHGVYEQGLDPRHAFTPMGLFVSLGIHESQSRLWENQVGRSRPFWEHHYGWAQALFPDALGTVSLDDFYGAINTVAPSLIRVEADEVTYNLHILVRFEMERELIAGGLDTADVPEAWNQKMTELVGVTPPDDARGCLQDIHWSLGALGYFATYALGNLYAAQFFAAARRDLPDLDDRMRRGDLRTLLDWLGTRIYRQGMRYRAGELCEVVTGAPLSIDAFMDYVTGKFRSIYGLD